MTRVELRPVSGQEIADAFYQPHCYSFGPSPSKQSRKDLLRSAPYRTKNRGLALLEDGMPMATGEVIPMTQAIRGCVYDMGGVADVATRPEARRKGYARRVMLGLLEKMRAAGHATSCLYPFRDSFYGRLGYINLSRRREIEFDPANLHTLLKAQLPGKVELLDMATGFDIYRDYLRKIRPNIHGLAMSPRSGDSRRRDENDSWLAVARPNQEEVAGIIAYHVTETPSELRADTFLYNGSAGKYLLLQWLARHVDQVKRVRLRAPSVDFLETCVFDLEANTQTVLTRDGSQDPMGRIVMVDKLSGMRVGEGRFSVRIVDEQCEWNNQAFCFAAIDGVLQVSRTHSFDGELSIQGLAGLVYMGADPEDFPYRGWGAPTREVQTAMRSMFPNERPYLHEEY
jgi:predicted acetyltransferase